MLVEALLVVPSTILTAAIRVTNQSRLRATGLERLFERLAHETLAQMICHRVADDPTAGEVFILIRGQNETNDPWPSRQASQPLAVSAQAR